MKKSNKTKEFFLHLTLNHQVLPEDIEGGTIYYLFSWNYFNVILLEDMPKYAAPTPDEIALAKGAFLNGVELRGRNNKGLTVT